jgi:hypothetical protein
MRGKTRTPSALTWTSLDPYAVKALSRTRRNPTFSLQATPYATPSPSNRTGTDAAPHHRRCVFACCRSGIERRGVGHRLRAVQPDRLCQGRGHRREQLLPQEGLPGRPVLVQGIPLGRHVGARQGLRLRDHPRDLGPALSGCEVRSATGLQVVRPAQPALARRQGRFQGRVVRQERRDRPGGLRQPAHRRHADPWLEPGRLPVWQRHRCVRRLGFEVMAC